MTFKRLIASTLGLAAVGLLIFAAALGGPSQGAARTADSAESALMKGWTRPEAPYNIAGSLYYVGSADPTAYLIDTGDGLILLDVGATPFAPEVLKNVRTLGFDPKTIRVVLNSHAHLDHAGGLAEVKAATGAKLEAMAQDAPILEHGGKGDPDVGDHVGFPPVKVDRVLHDGDKVALGKVTLTAHLTPGHTHGCTTWTMPLTVDGAPHTVTFICSLTILPGTPATAERAALWRSTYAKLAAMPCDLFLASHQSFYAGEKKRAAMAPGKPNPFLDPAGCKAFIATHKAEFETKFGKMGG